LLKNTAHFQRKFSNTIAPAYIPTLYMRKCCPVFSYSNYILQYQHVLAEECKKIW